jgi:hypothetical protein
MHEAEILNLEKQLLLAEVRGSAERIAELLAEECFEYGASGTIYRFYRGDTFDHGPQRNWEIVDFEARELAAGVVLATYRLLKHDEPNAGLRMTLRSSIWKLIDGKWKLVFHQGTPCKV